MFDILFYITFIFRRQDCLEFTYHFDETVCLPFFTHYGSLSIIDIKTRRCVLYIRFRSNVASWSFLFILDVNECLSSPCIHGQCLDLVDSFVCDCEFGFVGQFCENCKCAYFISFECRHFMKYINDLLE